MTDAYSQQYLGEKLSQSVAYDIRNAIYDRLQKLSFAYHDQAQIGQIMSRATQDVEAMRQYINMGLIRVGAILILIIFAIMLSRPMFQKREKRSSGKIVRSLVISALLFFGLNKAIRISRWPTASLEGDYSMQAIGKMLLKESALPFEVVSLVLLVAIIGALVISNTKDSAS